MSQQQPQETNEQFFGRADAFINLANEQIRTTEPGRVAASFAFGAARFSAWLAANRFQSADAMRKGKEEALQHFVQQFKQMLDDNLEDHIRQLERMAQEKK